MSNEPKFKWTTAPRYLFRITLAEELLDATNKRNFLEIGCGAGDFLVRLAKKGYSGVAIDFDKDAVYEAIRRLDYFVPNHKIGVLNKDMNELEDNSFDVILMMDVLEHIKEDEKALKKISSLLKEKGHFIMSVPCHMKKWSLIDEWGHYRRYERKELMDKLYKAGFTVERLYCYGFPFLNMISPIRDFLLKKQLEKDQIAKNFTKDETTKKSGIYRDYVKRFSFLSNKYFLFPFMIIQRLFFNLELGNGYVLRAVKRI